MLLHCSEQRSLASDVVDHGFSFGPLGFFAVEELLESLGGAAVGIFGESLLYMLMYLFTCASRGYLFFSSPLTASFKSRAPHLYMR